MERGEGGSLPVSGSLDHWISGSEESWGKLRREGVEYLGSPDHWIKGKSEKSCSGESERKVEYFLDQWISGSGGEVVCLLKNKLRKWMALGSLDHWIRGRG